MELRRRQKQVVSSGLSGRPRSKGGRPNQPVPPASAVLAAAAALAVEVTAVAAALAAATAAAAAAAVVASAFTVDPAAPALDAAV